MDVLGPEQKKVTTDRILHHLSHLSSPCPCPSRSSHCGWSRASGPCCCCTSPSPSSPSGSTSRSWLARLLCVVTSVARLSSLTWWWDCGPGTEDCSRKETETCSRSSCWTCPWARGTSAPAEAASSPWASCRHPGTLAASSWCSASSTWPAWCW